MKWQKLQILVVVIIAVNIVTAKKLNYKGLKNKQRIHNSSPIGIGDIPGVVFLKNFEKKPVEGGYVMTSSICTGTALDEHTVLTAAHCCCSDMQSAFPLEVHTSVIDTDKGGPDTRIFQTQSCIINSMYEKFGYCQADKTKQSGCGSSTSYDIAIIKMKEPINDPKVEFVELDFDPVPDQEMVTIAGYGRDENGDSGVLGRGNIETDTCTVLDQPIYGTKYNICYRTGPRNPQRSDSGDSGGPMFRGAGLAAPIDSFKQIGVNSGKLTMCLTKSTGEQHEECIGAYVAVKDHKYFIEGNMGVPFLESDF